MAKDRVRMTMETMVIICHAKETTDGFRPDDPRVIERGGQRYKCNDAIDVKRRQNVQSAAGIESPQRDGAQSLVFLQQEASNEKPANEKEREHPKRSRKVRVSRVVKDNHGSA